MAIQEQTTASTNVEKLAACPHKQKNVKPKKQFRAHDHVFMRASKKKELFNPYHSVHVPKETDLGGSKQELFVDGNTLMLRNVPHKYTQTELLHEIHELGFAETYDFFYLPMDTHHCTNVGYCFINFVDPGSALQCWSVMSNYKFKRWPSSKICAVCPAHLQGLETNVAHFQKCSVSRADNDQYRPVILRGSAQAKPQSVELAKVLFSDLLQGTTSADVSETNLYETSHSSFGLALKPGSDFILRTGSLEAYSENWQPLLLPEPQLDSRLSFVEALSELLRQKDFAHTGLVTTAVATKNDSHIEAQSTAGQQAVETKDVVQQVQRGKADSQDTISLSGESSAEGTGAQHVESVEHCDAEKFKRFHCYAARFRNASQEEKVKMCDALVAKLEKRLSGDNALSSKLLNQAIAWLTPPRSQAQHSPGSDDAMQSKLRQALIKSLKCADLQDDSTQQSLRSSLQHLKQMILQFEEEHQIVVKDAVVGNEWHRIRKIVFGKDVVPVKMNVFASKLSSSLGSEDHPECSFEPDDNTPRTSHSYLGDCFGLANVSALSPAYLAPHA